MSKVMPGRFTAQVDEPFVVFLIGMRVNQFFAFNKWTLVPGAMVAMLKELYAHPETGFLGGEQFFRLWPLTTVLVSYWRSFDDLERFARNPDDPHLPAWKQFNQRVGANGTVGIYHETYMIEPHKYEVFYGNMPPFGLGAATQIVAAVGRRETARGRAHSDNQPVVPAPAP